MVSVKWKRGWVALKTNNFPLITNAWAINHHLDDLVTNKAEYESRSIFTNQEEQTLVAYQKNVSRCNQGISRTGNATVILKLFEIRKWGF